MKIFPKIRVLSALSLGALAISGCSQKEPTEKPVFDAPPQKVEEPAKPALVADNSILYYSENLPKALAVWEACQKTGPDNMTDAERQNCVNAQQAWEFQPHKARK